LVGTCHSRLRWPGAVLRCRARLAAAVVLAAACRTTPAPELPPRIVLPTAEKRVEAWREDLAFFARELPRRHTRPFGVLPEERFRAAVLDLDRRIPELELARLAASIGDGHTDPVLEAALTLPLKSHR
jgi:hypothetical protein